jgi:hypothetical protein
MKAKRIYLRLNPGKDTDRRVLDYLENSGVSNGKAITAAVLDYLDRQEQKRESKVLLQEVKETILECFQTFQLSAVDRAASTPPAEESDDVSPLDFISDMTGGCHFGL